MKIEAQCVTTLLPQGDCHKQSGEVVAGKMDHSKVDDEAQANVKTWSTGEDEVSIHILL